METMEHPYEISCVEVLDTGEVVSIKDYFYGGDEKEALMNAHEYSFYNGSCDSTVIISANRKYLIEQ